jgi:hypothetical protein
MNQETPGQTHETPSADSSHVGADNVEVGRGGDAFQRLPTDVIQKCVSPSFAEAESQFALFFAMSY